MQYEIIKVYEYVNTKLYNLHIIINTYIFIHAHTMYIQLYELITKL